MTDPSTPQLTVPAWRCRDRLIDLSVPQIMGIVNVTPDSFSDGGRFHGASAAIDHGLQLLDDGATLLDIGGESTRPGAPPVGVQEELDRVLPVIEGLRASGAVLSVDTRKPEVMQACAQAGVQVLNDVEGFRSEASRVIAAASHCAVVAMHMQGTPETMQDVPTYGHVVQDVWNWLIQQASLLEAAGVAADAIVLDPGFGFGKRLEHNRALFRSLRATAGGRYPVLVGVSRKSMLGALTGRAVQDRMPASIAAVVVAAHQGVRLFRVHDVAQTRDALVIWQELSGDFE